MRAKVQINVRMSEEAKAAFQEEASRREMTLYKYVNDLMEKHAEKLRMKHAKG